MDHLTRPKYIPYDSYKFDIRCYTSKNFDGQDFDSYPESCGWDRRTGDEWYQLLQQGSESLQGFLQSWLYFGVMRAFFRHLVDIASFTKLSDTEPGSVLLDSSNLPTLFTEWLSDMNAFQNSDYMVTSDYITKAKSVHEVLRKADRVSRVPSSDAGITLQEYLHRWSGGSNPRDSMMVEAQSALFDAIKGALARGRVLQGSSEEGQFQSLYETPGGSSLEGGALWSLFRKDGWCPSKLAMIFGSFSLAGIYFMSHITRPNSAYSHIAGGGLDNEDGVQPQQSKECSNRRCSLYQLDQTSYRTKHTADSTKCTDMYVEDSQLLKILGQRKIPVALAIGESETGETIRLLAQDDKTPYLAISHVWADGLGNLSCNGIPRCQMLRLSKFARTIPPPSNTVCFWLDTLSCPPDSMQRPEEQNIALDLMRDTYLKANTVLVLDKWLATQQLCSCPAIDAMFKTICSPWTRRLWTLQEGALAQKLLIFCNDGLFEPDKVVSMLEQQNDSTDLLSIRTDILHRWYTIRGFKSLENLDLFRALYFSFAFRTTSVFEDEPLCLAPLFKFPVSEIAVFKTHQERMQKFWSMFQEFPAEIMDHYEARMTVPGFRWAPRSFMGSGAEYLHPFANKILQHGRWEPAVRTDGGLLITGRSYHVTLNNLPVIGPIFVRHPAGFWSECTFSFDLEAIEPIDVEDKSANSHRTIIGFSTKKSHGSGYIALIYHTEGHFEAWQTEQRQGSRITGTAASIQSVDRGVVAVRRFGLFVLAPVPQTTPIIVELEAAFISTIEAGHDAGKVVLKEPMTGSILGTALQPLPETQVWLLD